MAINPYTGVNTNTLRLFSNGESFLDNEGEPLVGQAVFYDNDHLHIPCVIYDKDGNKINNPVLTTNSGRLSYDVYLKNDKAYTVFFYKFQTGSVSPVFQFSVVLPKNIFVFDYGENPQSVEDYFDNVDKMADHIQDFHVGKIYGLKGYYTPGDKDLVYYKCEEYTGENDRGSTFTVFSADEECYTLRLIQSSVKYFDVRHFGIMPYNNSYVNISQLQNCDTYCYNNGYTLSFFPSKINGVYNNGYYFQNANLNLISNIWGTADTYLYFTNSNASLKFEDTRLNVRTSGVCNINITGTTLYQSNIHAGSESGVTLNPTINYVIDQYTTATIVAKNVNLIIITDSTNNVYNIDNCNIFSEAKINLANNNTIKHSHIRQSHFLNLTQSNIKNQTLSGNILNKDEWTQTYYWLAFAIVGKQQEIDLDGSVTIGGYTLDIDVDTVIKNGTLSNGTITFAQGLFTMENVTCSSSALIKTYTTVKTTSNNYNAILTGCTFEQGNKSQFICKTLKATNCDFLSAGVGDITGLNIDCEYIKAVNCKFYCDVFACSYIADNPYYISYFSNNNFHSNLYIRPGTATSSEYISSDWGLSYQMWNYGCTIMNNNFYEAADSAGHIRIYQITWDNQTVPNQTGYISNLLHITNNNIISNISQLPTDNNRAWNWIQWPERPTPNNPATGVLFKWTGAYTYNNNKGDFAFKYKLYQNCKTQRYSSLNESQYNVNDLICFRAADFITPSFAFLWKSPIYPFIFCFEEEKSRRRISYKMSFISWYSDTTNVYNNVYTNSHINSYSNSDSDITTYAWTKKHEEIAPTNINLKGVGDLAVSNYTEPYILYEGELTNTKLNNSLRIYTYDVEDGYPSTWAYQPDEECYHDVIINCEVFD